MSFKFFDILFIFIISISSSLVTYMVIEKNQEPKIAIVDMFELAKSIDPEAENREELIKNLIKKTKEKANVLWEDGYIVMKSSEFIEAPEYFYVEVE